MYTKIIIIIINNEYLIPMNIFIFKLCLTIITAITSINIIMKWYENYNFTMIIIK